MSNIIHFVHRFLLALSFLTILPVPVFFFRKDVEKNNNINVDFSKSSTFFPLIGLLIGSILFVSYLLSKYFPLPVHLQSGLILMLWIALS
ncbi:MAG: adenosylcobinamide-GDP ribazoletransferase, partial [Atribacterota bacterium]